MRWLLAALLLVAGPALADDWSSYANARFGYRIDVPPGFAAGGEADNGDGQAFERPGARLLVFGGLLVDGDFEAEVASRQQGLRDEGWTLTYEATTPGWASFSAVEGARISYWRMIALCDGAAFALYRLDYARRDIAAFDPVVSRLNGSFRPVDGACG